MSKNPPKNTKKRLVFFDVFKDVFWLHFGAKLVPQGGPGDLKKLKKIEKNIKKMKQSEKSKKNTALGTFLVSSCASGSILDGFWMDFGQIWEDLCDFWVIFGWILGSHF